MVNGVVRQLESSGDTEIESAQIGELVIQGLKSLDDVAYVRFASVYRDFREVGDFHALIDELSQSESEQDAARTQDAETAPGGR